MSKTLEDRNSPRLKALLDNACVYSATGQKHDMRQLQTGSGNLVFFCTRCLLIIGQDGVLID